MCAGRVRNRVAALVCYSTWCVTLDPCAERRSPWLLWQKWTAKPSGRIVGNPYLIALR